MKKTDNNNKAADKPGSEGRRAAPWGQKAEIGPDKGQFIRAEDEC